jgi:hypothetical protein
MLGQMKTAMAGWSVLEVEREFPLLRMDPWWLRFKALKIAFGSPNGIQGIEAEERQRLSNAIDIGFCLHVRIADVLGPHGEPGEAGSHRDKVLRAFLRAGFPEGSSRRIFVENLMFGDARGLLFLEQEFRDLFQRSMTRVEQKMARLDVHGHAGNQKELDLWLNYYLDNFRPASRVVPRCMMKHLRKPRVGIDISYRPERGWIFMSIQKIERGGLPPRQSSQVLYLPDRLTLFETPNFFMGLAHCILNGYVGTYRDDSGSEQRTVFEVDRQRVLQGNPIDDELAWLSAEQVERLVQRVAASFPYQSVDYRNVLKPERKVTGVFICLNLFRFGRVSILYRNNVNAWYCEEADLPALVANAESAAADAEALVNGEAIHQHVHQFLQLNKIDPAQVPIDVWVNPNSLASGRVKDYHALRKSFEQGTPLRDRILERNGVNPRHLSGKSA